MSVEVKSSYAPEITMHGNTFSSNYAPPKTNGDNAVLSISGQSSIWNIHGCNFNNSISQYEMSTSGFSGSDPSTMYINASDNFFTFTTASEISPSLIDSRIFDDDEESSNPQVFFEPFFSSASNITCPSDCSNQGVCVFPGFCVCEAGWTGSNCLTPTCQTINFCSNNGVCSEYETCDCDDGWSGVSCHVANCTERNNCNGNGFCAIPEVCVCDTGYDGQDCDECSANYRLVNDKCVECPVCENGGICNEIAQCKCPENYDGKTCLTCSE